MESATFRVVVDAVHDGRVRVSAHAVHALWGFDAPSRQAILITVYRPDPGHWSEDLRRRSARDVGEAE
jgi:hypothetical protein